jgi:tetratricopeptide (TPR) repeat protein
MSQIGADVHLKRAYMFVEQVEKATESFHQSALAHDAQVQDDNQPFLQGLVSLHQGDKRLGQQKAGLLNDLTLANQEIDLANRIDSEAMIEIDSVLLGATQLRAVSLYLNGSIEMIWGRSDEAKRLFNNALQVNDSADAHYMLGLLHESDYQPKEALTHFERCLELDPVGEFSVSAIREANAMRNYKKKFRGNWLLLIFLCFMYIIPGVIYYKVKCK